MNDSIFVDLVEGVRLCVMSLVVIVIPLVTDEREARNPNIVKRSIVAALVAFHPRLNQAQLSERRQSSVDCPTRGIILV